MASNPKGLGKVLVTTAATPVPCSTTIPSALGVTIQSDPANAGTYMYIKDAAGNIMAKITKGQSFTPPYGGNRSIDLSQIFLDTDTNGDGCYVAYF